MSRSRKKQPIHTIAVCKSQKKDKTLANRKFRRMEKQSVDGDKEPPFSKFQAADPWDFAGDGKMYHTKQDLNDWGDDKWKLFNK